MLFLCTYYITSATINIITQVQYEFKFYILKASQNKYSLLTEVIISLVLTRKYFISGSQMGSFLGYCALATTFAKGTFSFEDPLYKKSPWQQKKMVKIIVVHLRHCN